MFLENSAKDSSRQLQHQAEQCEDESDSYYGDSLVLRCVYEKDVEKFDNLSYRVNYYRIKK